MHDGSLRTLWDVMDHYNKGGETNPYLDGGIEPLNLSEDEINDVVAFLFSFTDTRFARENETALHEQQAHAARQRPFRDNALAHRRVLPWGAVAALLPKPRSVPVRGCLSTHPERLPRHPPAP